MPMPVFVVISKLNSLNTQLEHGSFVNFSKLCDLLARLPLVPIACIMSVAVFCLPASRAKIICGTCKFSIYTKFILKGRSLTILRFLYIPTSHISFQLFSLSHYLLYHTAAAYMSINRKVEIIFCPNLNFKIQHYEKF